MKIFIINLRSAIEKRKRMKKMLDKVGCDYEFFDAIKGSDVDPETYKSSPHWMDPYHHRHITQGEVGCALSHFTIWQRIVDSGIERAIIMEDDIDILDEDFIGKCESIKVDYDLIYLGRKKMDASIEEKVVTEESVVKSSFSYWTCAYAVSNLGAKRLTHDSELFMNNIIPIDEYIPYMCGKQHFDKDTSIRMEKAFGTIPRDVVSYAFDPPIIMPTASAFSDSSTYHSDAYVGNDSVNCLSIATDRNDCYNRYISSCERYGIEANVMGLGKKWSGGNMALGPGGGQKVNLLREYLAMVDDDELFVFTDNYDVIANDHVSVLVNKYKEYYDGKIVFAGETSCWPDASLSGMYPQVAGDVVTRFLNSGVFMGYARDIKKLVETPINNDADDQLYYTLKYLNGDEKIVIDYHCRLFLCLNGITGDVEVDKSKSCITYKGERPVFVHGNGPESIKIFMNNIVTNYCLEYNSTYGYHKPKDVTDKTILHIIHETITVDADSFVKKLMMQNYPKDKVDLLVIHNTDLFQKAFDGLIGESQYNSVIRIRENNDVWKQIAVWTDGSERDYIYYQECKANIDNPNCLTSLVSQNKNAVSPLLRETKGAYANFWGALDSNGYYQRSSNYFDIIDRNELGCWNVPYITHAFLLSRSLFTTDIFEHHNQCYTDTDMVMCSNIRNKFEFMYVLNTEPWGRLDIDVQLNTICSNQSAWEEKYLNVDAMHNNWNHEDLGDNIHKLHMFNSTFCEELIKLSESKSNWSQGGDRYYDKRIGNYENHPTQDIQLYDLELKEMWKKILDSYIAPFVVNEYSYHTKDINLAFVVKYSMDGQKDLKPHHDSSTYTVNVCLNKDFEGGGCNFVRSDKTIVNKDVGSMILHPGRLTHYHQGRPITDGTRYILVSFIN
jgi:procollagen-lysine,2-oxoglutarate 5-dioxygenase